MDPITGQVSEVALLLDDPNALRVTVASKHPLLMFGPDSVVTANGKSVDLDGLLAWLRSGPTTDLTDPTRPVFVTLHPDPNSYGVCTRAEFTR